jgi:DNA-binding MarR family transcriptional regulator
MGEQDWTDAHVQRWLPILPSLDPDVEAAVTRMKMISHHLKRVREQSLVDFGLQRHEYETLHALAGRGGRAAPSELADDLCVAPPSITGRLEGLEHRGFVRRTPSAVDRRRVDVELTDEGRAAWLGSIDVVRSEEVRLMDVLQPAERKALSDLLRRISLLAEQPAK